jgi:hypothetical protein
MKTISTTYPDKEILKETANTIMTYLHGNCTDVLTEMRRQYMCWGAKSFYYIASEDGCYGIQFKVSGLKHKGRVRIYYNPGSDYFDVELIQAQKNEEVWSCDDLDFTQLHNVLHQHIERDDDPEIELAG